MVETQPFDIQDHLKTPADRAACFDALLEDGDPSLVAAGLGDIARAIGVTEFARRAGISREAIDKRLVAGGNPTLDTIAKAAKALGLRLSVAPAE